MTHSARTSPLFTGLPSKAAAVRFGPRDGDIVIRGDAKTLGRRYCLWQHPDSPQFTCESRERALALAMEFGEQYAVRIWEQRGDGYMLITTHFAGK